MKNGYLGFYKAALTLFIGLVLNSQHPSAPDIVLKIKLSFCHYMRAAEIYSTSHCLPLIHLHIFVLNPFLKWVPLFLDAWKP